jgi:hypothetical protein
MAPFLPAGPAFLPGGVIAAGPAPPGRAAGAPASAIQRLPRQKAWFEQLVPGRGGPVVFRHRLEAVLVMACVAAGGPVIVAAGCSVVEFGLDAYAIFDRFPAADVGRAALAADFAARAAMGKASG